MLTFCCIVQEAACRPIPVLPHLTPEDATLRHGDFATASSAPATATDPESEAIALFALAIAARSALPALKGLQPFGYVPPGGADRAAGAVSAAADPGEHFGW